jgi:hypothetical protein
MVPGFSLLLVVVVAYSMTTSSMPGKLALDSRSQFSCGKTCW